MRETLATMRMMRLEEPTSEWEAMDAVVLPSFLRSRARASAARRIEKAKQFRLRNQHGIRRSFDDELRTVEAQMALCLMVGQEFSAVPTNHAAAKAQGNIGANCSAVVPKPGRFGMIVAEDEDPRRWLFLIQEAGDGRYDCLGWIRAGEIMVDDYRRDFVRDGVTSHPFIAPAEALRPLRTWFDR